MAEQPAKELYPIDMLQGMVSDDNPAQPENAAVSMLVTLSGMMMDVSLVHPEKAPTPMLVTLSGILIEVNPMQL